MLSEPHEDQLIEYESWLEILYLLHVPFEEQEDGSPDHKLHLIAEEWFLENRFGLNDLGTTRLYTMDDESLAEFIGECYHCLMHYSISEFCEMEVRPIPDGRGDPRLGHRQFSVLGYRTDEEGEPDYLVVDRIGVGEIAARDPDSLRRDVYGRLFGGFNIEVVE